MRVLFIPTTNSGITYWRMYNFAKSMNRRGTAEADFLWWQWGLNEVHPWQVEISNAVAKHAIMGEMNAQVREADVIVMQMVHTREALTAFYAIKDAYPEKPVLMEIDDNILSTPTYNPASDFYSPVSAHREIALDQMRAADGVICSTPYLAEIYKEFNEHTYVVQNSIDLDLWGKVTPKRRSGIRIGWAGGASHNEDLLTVLPAVKNILASERDVRFVLVHGVPNEFKDLPGVECVYKWARIDKYPQMLADQDFDIGMAPLVDNAFNRGKSNLRWLEYSALGCPTVASRVGHFAETIKDGVDGFLADSVSDFEAKLRLLISDRKARNRMAQEAWKRICGDFNIDTSTAGYVKTLEEVIKLGPTAKAPQDQVQIDLEKARKLAGELLTEEHDEPIPTP